MRYAIFLVTITTICVFAGCSKSKKGSSSGSMSAMINGASFSVQHCTIGGNTAGGLFVEGFDTVGVGRAIQFSITNYTAGATGTYAITAYPDITVSAAVDSNNTGQDAQTGSIIIKAYSTSAVSGTFSFTCTNGTVVTTVTNGVFEAVK